MGHSRSNRLTFGRTADGKAVVMPPETRDQHLYVCGRSGAGKTKFLEHLIRQDILRSPQSGCGMLVVDPHGKLYDDLINWMVFEGIDRPIVPIDLRRSDRIVSLNVLRKRADVRTSIIVGGVIEAMTHAWGAVNVDETPRLAKWMKVLFHTLYDLGLTLAEALELMATEPRVRQILAEKVTDRLAQREWENAVSYKPIEFGNLTESLSNRLMRFAGDDFVTAIIGQTDVSLDFTEAIDGGWIVLVNASTAGSNISREGARLFPTLLIDELWRAISHRGKSDQERPFRLYVDEFQEFVTPTIAKNLDQARGFGLEMVMAHQYPTQLLNEGPQGKAVYDSVMANASTKVVFETQHPDDLETLAMHLFRGVMNPDEIKHELYSTKVMGYEEVERIDRTTGVVETEGRSRSSSSGTGRSDSYAGDGASDGYSDSSLAGYSDTDVHSRAVSRQETHRTSREPILGKELSSVQFRSIEEQRFRAMQTLASQDRRYGVVKLLGERVPLSFKTPKVLSYPVSDERREAFIERAMSRWPFTLTAVDAMKQVADRSRKAREMLRMDQVEEPTDVRRSIL